jgi:hypothetical protein
LPSCHRDSVWRLLNNDSSANSIGFILVYNEAEKIADAISSVLWADEIVVADSGSTDRTVEIAENRRPGRKSRSADLATAQQGG